MKRTFDKVEDFRAASRHEHIRYFQCLVATAIIVSSLLLPSAALAFDIEIHNWGDNTPLTPHGVPGETSVSGAVSSYYEKGKTWTTKMVKHHLLLDVGQSAEITIGGIVVSSGSNVGLKVWLSSLEAIDGKSPLPTYIDNATQSSSSTFFSGSRTFTVSCNSSGTLSVSGDFGTRTISSRSNTFCLVVATSGTGGTCTETCGYTVRTIVSSSGNGGGSSSEAGYDVVFPASGGPKNVLTLSWYLSYYVVGMTFYDSTQNWLSLGMTTSPENETTTQILTASANTTSSFRHGRVEIRFSNGNSKWLTVFQQGLDPQKVIFNANGGTCGTSMATYAIGGKYSSLPTPSWEGHSFLGWYSATSGGTLITEDSAVSSSSTRTLYAIWNVDESAVVSSVGNPPSSAGEATQIVTASAVTTLRFVANGGKGRMAKQKLAYGSVARLNANKFTRKGYLFIGWAKTKNGAVALDNKGWVTPAANTTRTVTLYAKWAKKTYKVAFYSNGGKGKMTAQTFKYGKAAKLAGNKFKAPKGKKFAGWATSKANAKNGVTKYKNKAKVKNLLTNGKTMKLYAVWKKK